MGRDEIVYTSLSTSAVQKFYEKWLTRMEAKKQTIWFDFLIQPIQPTNA
jgi:hypothetical protein